MFVNSTKQNSSWEANSFTASQEIPRILRNPKVLYRIHNSPPPVSILNQHDPVHARITLLENPFYYYPPIYALVFQVISFSQVSLPKPCMHSSSPHTCCMPRPSHSSRFDHPNSICWGMQTSLLLITQSSPLSCYLIPLKPKYLPQHPVFETLNPCFSFSVRDQGSHPYKTTGKIMVLYILKVKLKCTLVQALRLCTGRTARTGSRGVALLFHDQWH